MKIKEYSFAYAKQFRYFVTKSRDGLPTPGDLVGPFIGASNKKFRYAFGIILWSHNKSIEKFENNAVGILWS